MILTLKSYFPSVDQHHHYSNIQVPDVATVQDLYKVACAETGISLTSPIQLSRNGVHLDITDRRVLYEAGIFPFDTIDMVIQTRGSTYSSSSMLHSLPSVSIEKSIKRNHEEEPFYKRRKTPFLIEIVRGIEQMGREPIIIDYNMESVKKRGKRVCDL